jgi:hypothetical protein
VRAKVSRRGSGETNEELIGKPKVKLICAPKERGTEVTSAPVGSNFRASSNTKK